MKHQNPIGLIGGMGPHASAYFYTLLLDRCSTHFGAVNNDEFPEILIDSVPVADFISDTNKLAEARDMLIERTKKLSAFGCSQIAMVCNTGHLLYPDLRAATDTPFVSLIDAVATRVKQLGYKRVGLFATQTTIRTGLYQHALSDRFVELFMPSETMQKKHEHIIRDVIAHGSSDRFTEELFEEATQFKQQHQLDTIILGCTELPLVFPKHLFSSVIDCLDTLADTLLSRYYKQG